MNELAWGLSLALGGSVVGLGASVFVYVAVSFFMSRRHVPSRLWTAALPAIVRETWLALWVTPLLLYFVFAGRRMGTGSGTPIVLVHGYTQNRGTFVGLARALARAGLGPVYGYNYWSFQDLRRSTVGLYRFIKRVLHETGARRVDLVAHSMGGLLALDCVRAMPRRVRRVVTIASPHRGVLWSGPILGPGALQLRAGSPFMKARATRVLGVPVLSLASTHDNVVHPASQSSVAEWGGKDVVLEGPGHLTILYHPAALEEVASFLRAPEPITEEAELRLGHDRAASRAR